MDIVKRYEELLKLDPGSIAFAPLAEELCYRGFWEGALKVCRQGLTHHPHHLRGRVLLGWALKELGEHEEAAAVLEEVEGEIQKNALLFRLLAELAKRSGDADRAERLLLIHQNLQPSAGERPTPTVAAIVEAPSPTVSPPEPPVISPPAPSVAAVMTAPPEPLEVSMPEPVAESPPAPFDAILPEPPTVSPPESPEATLPEPPEHTIPEPAVVFEPEPPMGSPPAAPEVELPEPPVVSEPEPSVVNPKEEATDFLSSLLDRYEALPKKSATEQRLFSEDDHRTLSRILKTLRH